MDFKLSLFTWTLSALMVLSVKASGECNQAIINCHQGSKRVLEDNSASNEQKCRSMTESLQCVKDLDCVTDVYFRLIYNLGVKNVAYLNCELEETFYPPISGPAVSCARSERTCLFEYVDKLEARDAAGKTINLEQAACQYLAEYVSCRHENSCTDKKELMNIVEQEQIRMNVACVIPTLVDSYNFAKCATAAGQCFTLDDIVDAEEICDATEKVVDCIGRLQCAPDVYLLLLKKTTKSELTGVSGCDVDQFYSRYLPTNSACDRGLNECAVDYLNNILTIDKVKSGKEKRTSVCKELNTLISCKQNVTSCDLDTDDLEDLVKFEKARIRISECEVTTINNGAREMFSVSVTAVMFLAILVVNVQNFLSL